ncbi:hypothetical protein LL033_21955 [Clostridium estertheticum]|uniref:hypothetical protein n=1 Tax=Clostridium estertheticum TaxID=238834 RepID=UPI001C0D56A5|nr:hypothetical protein [Clostridium estertheticum]MBU3217530.1 hypothetical protein [Clostridium estertheticum]WAG55239.1 hypothetical protein LL033_21955 [Clostridium estertheticum]
MIKDYFNAISTLQDKIIPGTSGKELTIKFLTENKDKEEVSVILDGVQVPLNTRFYNIYNGEYRKKRCSIARFP